MGARGGTAQGGRHAESRRVPEVNGTLIARIQVAEGVYEGVHLLLLHSSRILVVLRGRTVQQSPSAAPQLLPSGHCRSCCAKGR